MKHAIPILITAAIALLPAGSAVAQTKQTVHGAQAFLQGLVLDIGRPGVYARYGIHGVSTFEGRPGFYNVWLKAIDDLDESGKPDPCVTRMTLVDAPRPSVWAKGIRWSATTYDVVVKASWSDYPMPRHIRWGKASITRETFGNTDGSGNAEYIIASYRNPGAPSAEAFVIGASDPAVADRIEYAMKFLQASCDVSVETGF